MTRRWNDYITMKFVKLYQGEPILWDTSCPEYKTKRSRRAALDRIVTAMKLDGFGIEECKIKIKNMRSHYWQELSKVRDSLTLDPEQLYKPTVVWFETLDGFLRKFTTQNRNTLEKIKANNLDIKLATEAEHAQELFTQHLEEEDENITLDETSDNLEGSSTWEEPSVKRFKTTSASTCLNGDFNKFETALTTEFDLWARSIAMQLNNMELTRALDLQLQIQTMVSRERLAYESRKAEKQEYADSK